MTGLLSRVGATWERLVADVPRRELLHVATAMLLSLTLVAIYVLATRSHDLAGDEVIYHEYGTLFAQGELWHSSSPFGEVVHPSAWKPPGYPAWVGFWYTILGENALRVEAVQALLAPLTVLLAWLLARRLFGSRVAIVAAYATAAFPLVWEYFGLLFPEALSVPLTLLTLLFVLDRYPTPRLAAGVGALVGVGLLIRPTAFFILAAVVVAWVLAAGLRRGAAMAALTIAVAALVIVPWTIRNYIELDGFVPISVQESGAYGTFNEEAANDSDEPYSWRPIPAPYADLIAGFREQNLSEAELRAELYDLTTDYISEHPFSVVEAFYWNGIRRFWDLRPPSESLDEVRFQGRSELVRGAGLAVYYVLLVLAIVALWRIRHRREIVLPVIAMAIVASLAFTLIAGTRYRAPFEPVIAILACSLLAPRERRDPLEPEPSPARAGVGAPG